MIYHPILGIAFFFFCLFVAYFLGRQSSLLKKNTYSCRLANKKNIQDFIAPDASWLKEKNK